MRKLLALALALMIFALSCSKSDDAERDVRPPLSMTALPAVVAGDSSVVTVTFTNSGYTVITETGICYALTNNPTVADLKVTGNFINDTLRCTLKNLSSNKTYYVRPYYISSVGATAVYGNTVSFTTGRYAEMLGNNDLFNDRIMAISSDNTGNIYAAGSFRNADNADPYFFIARWNGSIWEKMVQAKSRTHYLTLASYNNILYFNTLKYVPALPLEHWLSRLQGNNFSDVALYSNDNQQILDICTDAAGDIYMNGQGPGSNGKYYIGHYTQAGAYEPLGNFNYRPECITVDGAGNLYVFVAGGTNTADVLKRTGNSFTSIKQMSTAWEGINAMTADPQGNIWATGSLHDAAFRNKVIKWNGSSWSEITIPAIYAVPNTINVLTSLCVDAQNNLYVSGSITNGQGQHPVLKWDGNNWTEIAAFSGNVHALYPGANGKIYIGGDFKNANGKQYVAVWNGN